jgi:predicted dehydrogenase
LLGQKDIDAVIISMADFQQPSHLRMVAEAGKDAYCEEPMANSLEEAKAARDSVLARDFVVQIGTQPYQIATKQWIGSGALGDVTKILWNYTARAGVAAPK